MYYWSISSANARSSGMSSTVSVFMCTISISDRGIMTLSPDKTPSSTGVDGKQKGQR